MTDAEKTAAPQTRTPEEIDRLKSDWLHDPFWNIETTPGFEAHHAELLAFRMQDEALRSASFKRRLEKRAAELGIPGQLELAEIIVSLETRIAELTERVDGLDATAADQDRMRVASYR